MIPSYLFLETLREIVIYTNLKDRDCHFVHNLSMSLFFK